jgi:hypothetical protein
MNFVSRLISKPLELVNKMGTAASKVAKKPVRNKKKATRSEVKMEAIFYELSDEEDWIEADVDEWTDDIKLDDAKPGQVAQKKVDG